MDHASPTSSRVAGIEGNLDLVTHNQLAGWARNSLPGGQHPLTLAVFVDGQQAGLVLADRARDDLVALGMQSVAFEFNFSPPLSAAAHRIAVSEASTGLELPNSPRELPCSLDGHVDQASHRRIAGWVRNTADPGRPVSVLVAVNGQHVGRVLANAAREDLVRNGVGAGRHSFEYTFEPPLSSLRHVISLTCEASGASLPDAPCVIEASHAFDASARKSIAAIMDSFDTDAGLTERLEFLSSQVARLLLLRSDRQSRRGERLAERQFRRRWIGQAPSIPALLPRRALIIDATMPDIGRDAGSVAIVSHALSLQRLGFEVVLAAADMGAEGAAALEALGIACCHAPWFGSIEEVLRAEAEALDLVYLHRVSCAFPYTALVRRHAPRARILYGVADLHHLRIYRQSIAEGRPELQALAGHVRAQELWAAAQADVVITHSEPEAAILRQADPSLQPHVIPWVVEPRPGAAGFDERNGVAFIGNYAHKPNVDTALFLIDEIMPLIHETGSVLDCHLIGSAMPASLTRRRPQVVVHGWVDDLAGLLNRVRLTVAPLTYGAGIKGKVLNSMAAGLPCICTPVAAEGIELGPAYRSLVASSAPALAASIARLHADPALYAECVREGLAYVTRRLGSRRIDALMQAAVALNAVSPP